VGGWVSLVATPIFLNTSPPNTFYPGPGVYVSRAPVAPGASQAADAAGLPASGSAAIISAGRIVEASQISKPIR
jgi:hypothetical protein